MKPRTWWRAAAAFWLPAAGAACLRFFPSPPPAPASLTVDRHVLCAAVETGPKWASPGPDQRIFRAGRDERIFSFLEFRRLAGVHTLAWKWYDPGGALVRSTAPLEVGEAGRIFEAYIAWDVLAPAPDLPAGTWTVTVFADGVLAEERTFEVRRTGPD